MTIIATHELRNFNLHIDDSVAMYADQLADLSAALAGSMPDA